MDSRRVVLASVVMLLTAWGLAPAQETESTGASGAAGAVATTAPAAERSSEPTSRPSEPPFYPIRTIHYRVTHILGPRPVYGTPGAVPGGRPGKAERAAGRW